MVRYWFNDPLGTFIKDVVCVAILMYVAYCCGARDTVDLFREVLTK